MTKIVRKNCKFYEKIDKTYGIKKLKTILWPIKDFSNLSSRPTGGFLVPGAGKTFMTTNFEKSEKKFKFYQTIAKTLKIIPLPLEIMQQTLLSNPRGGCLALEAR